MDELTAMRESARLWRETAKRLERENQWLREKLDGRAEAKRAMRAAILRSERREASA